MNNGEIESYKINEEGLYQPVYKKRREDISPDVPIVLPEPPMQVEKPIDRKRGDNAEYLWNTYKIPRGAGLSEKVDVLLTIYNMDDPAFIAKELMADEGQVKELMAQIEKRWTDIGAPLNEQRTMIERGKILHEMELMLKQINELYNIDPQDKYLTMKATFLDRIIKLRNLDAPAKRTTPENENAMVKLNSLLSDTPVEVIQALVAMLKAPDVSP